MGEFSCTQIWNSSSCSSERKKRFFKSVFWVRNILPRSLISLSTNIAKKIWPIFWPPKSRFWPNYGVPGRRFWLKCSPSIADWSLKSPSQEKMTKFAKINPSQPPMIWDEFWCITMYLDDHPNHPDHRTECHPPINRDELEGGGGGGKGGVVITYLWSIGPYDHWCKKI